MKIYLALLADARAALEMVQSSPELSLNQIGKREGRCRTHLARLLRIAWLSPRIVETIVDGSQPRKLNRQTLLAGNSPSTGRSRSGCSASPTDRSTNT